MSRSQGAHKADWTRRVKRLPGILPSRTVDLSDEDSVKRLFSQTGSFDHLVVAGSSVETGPFRELSLADARASVDSKFWGQYGAARYAQIRPKGSIITLFSGILSRGPAAGLASLAAINAAVEALGQALAFEVAHIRVSVVSPDPTGTPAYAGMPDDARECLPPPQNARSSDTSADPRTSPPSHWNSWAIAF
jgi:NAD(P)-dependent dehydrogenase (short-subunit alcohol dehydrogenase family)